MDFINPKSVLKQLNEGNHGEQGNPHPQYQPYILTTPSNAGVLVNPYQWAKMAEQTFYLSSYLTANKGTIQAPTPVKIMSTFLLQSVLTDSPFVSALVTLRLNFYQSLAQSRFSVDILPLTAGDNLVKGTNPISVISYEDLIRVYVTDNGNNTFKVQVFAKYFTNYMAWRLKCLQFDFISSYIDWNNTIVAPNYKGFISFQNENRMADWFFGTASTSLILDNDASFPIAGASTLLIQNSIMRSSMVGSSLPTASKTYWGKIFTLDNGNNFDTQYICSNVNGTFTWRLLTPTTPRVQTISSTSVTTLDTTYFEQFNMNQASATTITTLNGGVEGKEVLFVTFTGGTSTLQNSGSIKLKGGTNATLPLSGVLKLRYTTGNWYELYRNF